MNSSSGLLEAICDYQLGKMGVLLAMLIETEKKRHDQEIHK
jgi:hypothetical protein